MDTHDLAMQTQQHCCAVSFNIQPINSRLWGKEQVIISIGHLHLLQTVTEKCKSMQISRSADAEKSQNKCWKSDYHLALLTMLSALRHG